MFDMETEINKLRKKYRQILLSKSGTNPDPWQSYK